MLDEERGTVVKALVREIRVKEESLDLSIYYLPEITQQIDLCNDDRTSRDSWPPPASPGPDRSRIAVPARC